MFFGRFKVLNLRKEKYEHVAIPKSTSCTLLIVVVAHRISLL